MQCIVGFGYQLNICSATKENHGKPCSSWPIAGPSACELTSSQQSGVEYASPNIVSLSVRLLYYKIRILFVLQMFYIHIIWISNIPYTSTTLRKMMDTIPNMNTRKNVYIYSVCNILVLGPLVLKTAQHGPHRKHRSTTETTIKIS
jgi:hypothetical protein